MNSRFVLTGGPGAGKTTVLEALKKLGHKCAPESARKIIQDRLSIDLSPRPEPIEFAELILQSDICKYTEFNDGVKPIFFDRGVLDSLYMLNVADNLSDKGIAKYTETYGYNSSVFIFPPWAEIYHTDEERDQDFTQAIDVFDGIKAWYSKHGYKTIEVPKLAVKDRVDFIENKIVNALKN